jgi:hypothetical protein
METARAIADFLGTYSGQVFATAAIFGMTLVIYCQDQDNRELRAELKRYRQAEDDRRGISEHETCQECSVNVAPGQRLCRTCLQTCLQSGSH